MKIVMDNSKEPVRSSSSPTGPTACVQPFIGLENVSVEDVLSAQRDVERQAEQLSAAAGDTTEKCTHSSGYIRQSVYACITCREKSAGSGDRTHAGICRGCAFTCHLDHEVDELFTRRAFKCDCGNPKFRATDQSGCTLRTNACVLNEANRYGHNYDGKYCYCDKAYDPDTDTMLQCTRCEDWFHDSCLTTQPPEDGEGEMFCRTCIAKCPFLMGYARQLETEIVTKKRKIDTGSTPAATESGENVELVHKSEGQTENGEKPADNTQTVADSAPADCTQTVADSAPADHLRIVLRLVRNRKKKKMTYLPTPP
eukprot:823519_1